MPSNPPPATKRTSAGSRSSSPQPSLTNEPLLVNGFQGDTDRLRNEDGMQNGLTPSPLLSPRHDDSLMSSIPSSNLTNSTRPTPTPTSAPELPATPGQLELARTLFVVATQANNPLPSSVFVPASPTDVCVTISAEVVARHFPPKGDDPKLAEPLVNDGEEAAC